MSTETLKKERDLRDNAQGAIVGFIFQFQFALVLLADLTEAGQSVSIEKVDDIGVHSPDGAVIASIQAKHSIVLNGSAFRDSGKSLWRTVEIWISKLKMGVFSENTQFLCATNKAITKKSLLYKIANLPFDDAIKNVENLLQAQEDKLLKAKIDGKKASLGMSEVVGLIQFALNNKNELKIIFRNLKIEEEIDARGLFLNKIYANTTFVSEETRCRIYESFYGWIIDRSGALWKNAKAAEFTKEHFDNKHHLIIHSPSFVNAIFRTKQSLGSISERDILDKHSSTFVKQLEGMRWRDDVKERKIKAAILEFICHDIELEHVVRRGDFTQSDFEQFLESCKEKWQKVFDEHFCLELDEYSEDDRHNIANAVFNEVMSRVEVDFKSGFSFNPENEYVRNGAFYKLSDVPLIGWHPEWRKKYVK